MFRDEQCSRGVMRDTGSKRSFFVLVYMLCSVAFSSGKKKNHLLPLEIQFVYQVYYEMQTMVMEGRTS